MPSDGCGAPSRFHGAEPTYEQIHLVLPLVSAGLYFPADVEHVAIPVAMEVPIVCQNELVRGLVSKSAKEHRRIDCGAIRNVRRDIEGGRDVVGAVEIARVVGGPQHGSHGRPDWCQAARESWHAQSPWRGCGRRKSDAPGSARILKSHFFEIEGVPRYPSGIIVISGRAGIIVVGDRVCRLTVDRLTGRARGGTFY